MDLDGRREAYICQLGNTTAAICKIKVDYWEKDCVFGGEMSP